MTINVKIPWGWIVAGLVIAYLVWVQACHHPGQVASVKTLGDTVRKAEKADDHLLDTLHAHDKAHAAERAAITARAQVAEGKLKVANSIATALANEVADARLKKDTVRYYNKCDSLAAEVKNKDYLYQDAQAHLDSERVAYGVELGTKDSIIDVQARSRVRLTAAFNEALAAAQHNALYAGISGLGNTQTQGVGPELEYVTKKGYTYSAGGYFMNGLPMLFSIGVKKKISFKHR